MILRKVLLAPYIVELWIVITDNPTKDIPKINKKYKGLDIPVDWEETAAWTNDHFMEGNILGVAFDAAYCDPNTVTHEAVHIVNRTFKHAGYKNNPDNDEHQAYFTGWIVEEIYKAHTDFLTKQKKQKK